VIVGDREERDQGYEM